MRPWKKAGCLGRARKGALCLCCTHTVPQRSLATWGGEGTGACGSPLPSFGCLSHECCCLHCQACHTDQKKWKCAYSMWKAAAEVLHESLHCYKHRDRLCFPLLSWFRRHSFLIHCCKGWPEATEGRQHLSGSFWLGGRWTRYCCSCSLIWLSLEPGLKRRTPPTSELNRTASSSIALVTQL